MAYVHLPQLPPGPLRDLLRLIEDQVSTAADAVRGIEARTARVGPLADTLTALTTRTHRVAAATQILPPSGDILDAPLPPPSPPPAPAGQLSVEANMYFAVNGTPILPVFCHFMEAFSAYTRRPADVTAQLDTIASAGYVGIRFLDLLGYFPFWVGREVAPIAFTSQDGRAIPATPNYYTKLAAFLAACRARNLRVHWSRGDLQMLSSSQRVEHFDRLGDLAASTGTEVVGLFEGLNEAWQNGEPSPNTLRTLVTRFSSRAGSHVLTALSSPTGNSEEQADLIAWSEGVPIAISHSFRGGHFTDKIRHLFSTRRENWPGKPVWMGEPPGPGEDVSVISNPGEMDAATMGLLAAVALLSGEAWTYMSGYGVRWKGPLETQPGFYNSASVRTLLPTDLQQWETITHGGAGDARVTSATGFEGDAGFTNGPARIDQRWSASRGQIVAAIYGGTGAVTLEAISQRVVGTLYDPASWSSVGGVDIAAGATQGIPGYSRGLVLLGTLS